MNPLVCTRCGARVVPAAPLVCEACGHRQEFVRQPLYCLVGPSGTGKSTVGRALLPQLRDRFVVLEQDVLWVPELRDPAGHHRAFRSTWLRLAATIGQSGRPVLLCGTVVPPELELLPERALFREIHYLALTCRADALAARLRARPAWREWDEPRIVETLEYAAWLERDAGNLEPPVELLDTTERSIEETVEAVCGWLAARAAVRAPAEHSRPARRPSGEDGGVTLTVLLPTTVPLPDTVPDGTRYVPYDPRIPLPDEHLEADVLGVWGNPDPQLADCARRLRRLRLVQLFSAGSDNAARAGFAPGVVIASGRGLHDRPVAEHTLALVLAAARRLHRAFTAQRDHEWATDIGGLQPEPSPGVFSTLRGARVTVWGFGSIGRTLAPHLIALGATVTGVARHARQEGPVTVIAESRLPDHLAQTDVLIMILPSTPATRGALDADTLAALPPHAWVINVGRGDAVDEPALMDALRSGSIAGAALDVTSTEPLPADSPLWDTPNLIITPHAAGGRPLGALDLLAENLDALSAGRPLRNVVET